MATKHGFAVRDKVWYRCGRGYGCGTIVSINVRGTFEIRTERGGIVKRTGETLSLSGPAKIAKTEGRKAAPSAVRQAYADAKPRAHARLDNVFKTGNRTALKYKVGQLVALHDGRLADLIGSSETLGGHRLRMEDGSEILVFETEIAMAA